MTRVALYARYSSDNQRDASIDDQLRLCREYAEREGWQIVDTYTDAAISGASLILRPGIRALLADAQSGRFEVVLAEALDRLSRDQEDTAALYKRLRFAEVRVITLSEGTVDELHVGLKGTMNALFLRDLAAKIKRGQIGRIANGYSAGNLPYGYRVVKKFDERGEPIRGLREIDEEQAEVIRRIFREFASGLSAWAIAARLDRDRIPPPLGSTWSARTINGNLKRRSGILHNEAYIGLLVFNRVRTVKHPETGKRISRTNPPEQRHVAEVPHLRIVTDEVWNAVQTRKKAYDGTPVHERCRPKHMFSGLVRCGCCGAPYTIKSRDRLSCAAHYNKGICDNSRTARVRDLEGRVLGGLKRRLLAPDAIEDFLEEYQAERKRLEADAWQGRQQIEKRLAAIERQIANLVDSIADGAATASMKSRLIEIEAEKERLAADLERPGNPMSTGEIQPASIDVYRRKIAELQDALAGDGLRRQEATNVIRSLVERIEVKPGKGRGNYEVTLVGALAEILNLPSRKLGEILNTVASAKLLRYHLPPPTLTWADLRAGLQESHALRFSVDCGRWG